MTSEGTTSTQPQIRPAGQAKLEEPFAPLGHHLPGSLQAGGDLVIARPSAAYSTILALMTSTYGDVYLRARVSSPARSASVKIMLNGLVRGVLLPSLREPCHVTMWNCGTETHVTVIMSPTT